MSKSKLFNLITNITKKILLFTAVISVSQCSVVWDYEVTLNEETANLIRQKKMNLI